MTSVDAEPLPSATKGDPFLSGDQRRIRPTAPITDLAVFLTFLEEIEALFGPISRPRRIGRGTRFLL